MDLKSKATSQQTVYATKLARAQQPLVLLRDTEAILRRKTVDTLVPVLPPDVGDNLQKVSGIAEACLQELVEIDIEQISDIEFRPARIFIGLSFVGFGALFVALLLLYLSTLHPELSSVEQIRKYWDQYVWFVCLGVTGMFLLGREAMRTKQDIK